MFESYEVPRQVLLFKAAIELLAHKDITPDRAVSDAVKIWEQSVEAAIVYEKTEDCTCAACCQKEMYVSEDRKQADKWYRKVCDKIEKDGGEDGITLEECIQRGYNLISEEK